MLGSPVQGSFMRLQLPRHLELPRHLTTGAVAQGGMSLEERGEALGGRISETQALECLLMHIPL